MLQIGLFLCPIRAGYVFFHSGPRSLAVLADKAGSKCVLCSCVFTYRKGLVCQLTKNPKVWHIYIYTYINIYFILLM